MWAVLARDGDAWEAERAAVRLDPASLAEARTVWGGGAGGEATWSGAADMDGDGDIDWYIAGEHVWYTTPVAGETISMCDVPGALHSDWVVAYPLDDVDAASAS